MTTDAPALPTGKPKRLLIDLYTVYQHLMERDLLQYFNRPSGWYNTESKKVLHHDVAYYKAVSAGSGLLDSDPSVVMYVPVVELPEVPTTPLFSDAQGRSEVVSQCDIERGVIAKEITNAVFFIDVLGQLIEHALNQALAYRRGSHTVRDFFETLLDPALREHYIKANQLAPERARETYYDFVDALYAECFEPQALLILDILSGRNWNVVRSNRLGTRVLIEISDEDWRVKDWMRRFGSRYQ